MAIVTTVRRLLVGCCAVAVAVAAACGGGQAARVQRAVTGDIAIVGATVIPMDREGVLADHTVLVRGDRIVAVAPAGTIDTGGATVIDARGKWLLPGLADMHVHIWNEDDLDLFVLNGVTTVRNLFGAPKYLVWRDAIARGELAGPTLFTAGPIIDGDPPTWPGSAVVTTAEAARAEVAKEKAAGYDWIKVYNSLPAEAYRAVIEEAKRQNIPVAGHVPRAVGIDGVLASGQRSIEHLDGYIPFFGELPKQPLIAPTVKAGVWNCPTLVVTERFARLDHPDQVAASTRGMDLVSPEVLAFWDPKQDFRLKSWTPERFEELRKRNQRRDQLVRELAKAGAKLVLGTDTGNPFVVPGFAVVDELALLVKAGLTPWQALRTATVAAAELAGTPGRFGAIAPGARADLIVVGRDPLADVTGVADPEIVVVRGKVKRRDELLAAAKQRTEPAQGADPFAKLPALEAEGERVVAARYEAVMFDQVIGVERVVLSRGDGKVPVVRGQAVYTRPMAMQMTYRSTRDRLELTSDTIKPDRVVIERRGAKVVAQHGTQPAVERAAAADAVITPQAIVEQLWYAAALADLKVGGKRKMTAVGVNVERDVALDPTDYVFERKPDANGRRVYSFSGKAGSLDVTGSMTVDPDGAPAEVFITIKFGTFVLRRVPEK